MVPRFLHLTGVVEDFQQSKIISFIDDRWCAVTTVVGPEISVALEKLEGVRKKD